MEKTRESWFEGKNSKKEQPVAQKVKSLARAPTANTTMFWKGALDTLKESYSTDKRSQDWQEN